MQKLWSRRPSPAMVVACFALLVALGGTSIAAVTNVPRNSVGPRAIQFGAVTNPKIRNNAVTSAKVRNRSLLRADFAPGQIPAGPTGPQGPAGATGPTGPAGAAGTFGAVTVRTESVVITDPGPLGGNGTYTTARVTRNCVGNERAISGGTSWSDDVAGLKLFTGQLQPQLNAQSQVVGFLAVGANDSGQGSTFTVHVLCYTP